MEQRGDWGLRCTLDSKYFPKHAAGLWTYAKEKSGNSYYWCFSCLMLKFCESIFVCLPGIQSKFLVQPLIEVYWLLYWSYYIYAYGHFQTNSSNKKKTWRPKIFSLTKDETAPHIVAYFECCKLNEIRFWFQLKKKKKRKHINTNPLYFCPMAETC